jgi:uncharacterized membrane protein YoaK (UPF0700 family)
MLILLFTAGCFLGTMASRAVSVRAVWICAPLALSGAVAHSLAKRKSEKTTEERTDKS